ncbi:type I site-specific deoxyribonuclease [Cyanobium sp. PCC 7001]|nr:type I site-specific deoxyribonuclease [Cyanobium sp. PCC 7001]
MPGCSVLIGKRFQARLGIDRHSHGSFFRNLKKTLGNQDRLGGELGTGTRAIFHAYLLAWAEESQPDAWEALQKNHGASATATLLNRLRAQLDQRCTLDVLRHGIELLDTRKPLQLAQFKPALALNPKILSRYDANRLRVVRQMRYLTHNEHSIYLVLFLNGIAVATPNLKTHFSQSIDNAVDQYRFDRNHRPKGQRPEPLLSFPTGALVHFAVSTREVRMTSKLLGPGTIFLPFNRGDDGGAGNPLDAERGYRTGYLWEEVWQRHSSRACLTDSSRRQASSAGSSPIARPRITSRL